MKTHAYESAKQDLEAPSGDRSSSLQDLACVEELAVSPRSPFDACFSNSRSSARGSTGKILTTQEDELATIRKQIEELRDRQTQQKKELDDYLLSLTIPFPYFNLHYQIVSL